MNSHAHANQNFMNIRNRLDVQDVVAVSHHNWFNPQLKEKAIDAVEGFVHALHNNMPRVVEDYRRKAVATKNMDQCENAIDKARRLGIGSKLFTVLEELPLAPTRVRSSQFDWAVKTIDSSREPIPVFALKNLTALRQSGCVFDALAVAAPLEANFLAPRFVFSQETQKALLQTYGLGKALAKKVGRTSVKMGRAAAVSTSTALKKMAEASVAMARVPKEFIKDPVLLGSYGQGPCFMIEIARWE